MDRRENFVRTSLRLPQELYDRLVAATEDKRSLNAEIIARLEQSLEGYFLDLSGVGFVAMVKRLEAATEANEMLLFRIRDELPALDAYMLEHGIDRPEAIRRILSDWLKEHGHLAK